MSLSKKEIDNYKNFYVVCDKVRKHTFKFKINLFI